MPGFNYGFIIETRGISVSLLPSVWVDLLALLWLTAVHTLAQCYLGTGFVKWEKCGMHNWNQSGPLTACLESIIENPWPASSSQQEWWTEASGVATAWMWYERRIKPFISILMKVSLLSFFQQCSPWPDVPYQMNNAPSPSYNSSPNSFNLGDGYVKDKCFIFPVYMVAFVHMHFVCPCISYPGGRGQGSPFLERGNISHRSF